MRSPWSEVRSLLMLIIAYAFLLGMTIFILRLGVAIYFSLLEKDEFFFDWLKAFKYSIRVGISAGIPLGVGVWGMAKLQEKKSKSSSSGPEDKL